MKLTYAVVHEQTPNNYCAYVPDLPGCIGTGKTWDEIQRTMQEAIELHLEGILECGLPLPEPRMSLKEAEAQHSQPLTEEEQGTPVPFPDSQSTLPTTYGTVEVCRRRWEGEKAPAMTEIIFEVTEDEVDGGYSASAIGYGIHTQGDSLEEVRSNVKEAVDCHFDSTMPRPQLIRLHFVRDEVLTA